MINWLNQEFIKKKRRIDKFGNAFYLIIYLAHFIIVGSYAYQLVFDTKKFLKGRGVDKTATLIADSYCSNGNIYRFY